MLQKALLFILSTDLFRASRDDESLNQAVIEGKESPRYFEDEEGHRAEEDDE